MEKELKHRNVFFVQVISRGSKPTFIGGIMMKPKDHQEKQQELEQVFQQNQPKDMSIKKPDKVMSQSDLVELSGMLFESDQQTNTPQQQPQPQIAQQIPNPTQSAQIPPELLQAQQAVHQAQLTLLSEQQQLEQALYQLHQAQDRVKQCQLQVQQAQKQMQSAQATASSFVNNMYH